MRADLDIIQEWIAPGSRVLDLGCGDGELLAWLRDNKQVSGYGLEIDPDKIALCIERGVNVIEQNLDQGLANFDDANLRRSAQAAVTAGAKVERALEILGDEVPDHLRYAGRLRLEHKQASLDELGRLADPPMTKDAVAGRIRRLLAMADKRAAERGIPGTDAASEG